MPREKRNNLLHNLVYLNRDIAPIYILSYLNYINNNRTETKAKQADFVRLFNKIYNRIKETGEINPTTRMKSLHFRPNTISPSHKKELTNKLNGLVRRAESIKRISGKEILKAQGSKVTQKAVQQLIESIALEKGYKSVSIATIKRYWNEDIIDLKEIVEELNDTIDITYLGK